MVKAKYHHVSLRVHSAERSIEFYQKLFGYREVKRHNLSGDGKIIHLTQDGVMPVLEIIQDNEVDTHSCSTVHLGFYCPNLREFLDHLSEMGWELERGPLSAGCETILFIRDPDGYLIEINDGLSDS